MPMHSKGAHALKGSEQRLRPINQARRRHAAGLLAGSALLAATTWTHNCIAQEYPARPIRVITNVGSGGTADIFIRALGEELHRRWGEPLIVDPRPGGNFIIAGRACAESPPDGYTVCLLSGETLNYNQFLYKRLPYDPQKDFAPITNLFFNTQALVVNAALNAKSLDELAALARARPKTLAYVAPSLPHALFFEHFNRERGTDLVRVPFRGGGEAVTGILSGATPVAFFGLANFLSYLREATMIGLAMDGAARSPLFPGIPTLAELGYHGNLTRVYFGLVAPAGTPQAITERLRGEIARIMNEPDFRAKQLIERVLEPIADTPGEFARFLNEDRLISERVVKEAGMTPQ
jgi:tripartite-type tricarboxylate transporter receptor subunit TctC